MAHYSKETAKKILSNEISVETLLRQYPEYKEVVLKELSIIKTQNHSNLFDAMIAKYTTSAKLASKKIINSGMNEKTVNAFLPDIIKARFAIYLLEHLSIAASSESAAKAIRFNLWDGMILQRLLFRRAFERKPVSMGLFRFFWRFVINKKILMPLVNKKGIYCFYSRELISQLSKIIGDKKCLEIASGDGTLTKFLNETGVNCKATDDYSWEHYITYPDFVEKADARTALHQYNPQVVLCSWPVPKNTYEKHVFKTSSVEMYIVIGTNNPKHTGDFESYYRADDFIMELSEELTSLLLPPSDENAVYIFRRHKNK
ncbi:hypothetical protein [Paenibacillus macerans]|uniref:hypothetical protein n=1 Tax=Paenibacillus macerans TaxID=44252 RepID=UPI00203D8A0F|nr:hypothetical protein [Paenibacillus macerans]MCM3702431.1 hypothetical protein [Paenibacillus macerans]